MTRDEARQLVALARRLESTPRHVLIHAARMIEQENSDACAALLRIRQIGMRHCVIVDGCANLLLTPVASYAQDALGSALDLLWQGAYQASK